MAVAALLVLSAACDKSKGDKADAGAATAATAAPTPNLNAMLQGFEGEIGMHVEAKGDKPLDLAVSLKKDRVRVDVPEGMKGTEILGGSKGYLLLHTPEKKLYFVSDTQKKVIFVDLDAAGETVKSMTPPGGGAGGGAGAPKIENTTSIARTGKSARIAGIDCEEWEIKDKNKPTDTGTLCLAEESTSWLKLPLRALPDSYGFAAQIMDGKHFPLRFIGMSGAAQTLRLEATKIEKKVLDDVVFAVPKGYETVDLLKMLGPMRMGGMPGMPGMPGAPGGPPGLRPHKPGK
jgi:hypothetical protein